MSKLNKARVQDLKMVVFIVKKGLGTFISTEARKLGATRRIILLGKGTAPKKIYLDFLGIDYDPEKEVVMMLVQKKCLRTLMDTLTALSNIDQPGNGVAFVLDVSTHAGWLNLLPEFSEEQTRGGKSARK
jgi:nitrogen regulatory protein P-II 1